MADDPSERGNELTQPHLNHADGESINNKFDNVSILAAIQEGSKEAESRLVNYYSRSLGFILNRRCNDPELVKDLVQDTFIVVILRARKGEISSPASLASFIRQTGVNLLLGHFRKEKRRSTDPSDELDKDHPSVQVSIQRQLSQKESVELVAQTLEEMPVERDRELIKEYFVKEKTKKELCAQFEISAAHFDRVLYRARNRLKQLVRFKLGAESLFND